MRVSEIFRSIQGEGRFTGVESVFVRTTGCNLRCWYCDTPYTSWEPVGEQKSWWEVAADVIRHDCPHVVLTGGEPLLSPDIVPLSQHLREQGHIVTVETAGTVYRPVVADLMSISPKLANSQPRSSGRWFDRHARDRERPDVVRRLLAEYDCQLKFVVDEAADLEDIERFLALLPAVSPNSVWLMPQGITPDELAEKATWLPAAATRLGFHYCPRRQIELFGNVRGT
ncbi:MAG: 7-carboxy-7-deazaguanine synthase QueE [Planctomycetaceae bacterium]|nr:7-carboxy-7-deazaguanine synthase QueE [Planctomycetaceae bacterium]